MVIIHGRSKRKNTGGRYKSVIEKKRKYKIAGQAAMTRLEEQRTHTKRSRGGNRKTMLYAEKSINVFDPKSKKYEILTIKTIVEAPANRHYVRRNIMTKGTIVDTEKGRVKITSRPGQTNRVNGVLIV